MFQVNRDDVAFVCVPVLSDPDKKRNLYLEIETRLVCYILQEKHNHFLEIRVPSLNFLNALMRVYC